MDICVWGDSITYGAGDGEALGWVGRLRKFYEHGDEVGVYNRGICGDTSEDVLKRFEVEYESIQPATVIFAVGVNDSKYPAESIENHISIEKFKENMKALINKASIHPCKVYIMGCTQVDEAPRHSGTRFSNEQIQLYNDVLKEMSKAEQLEFIDVFGVIDPVTDLCDGLHPNAQGYEKLTGAVLEALK